MKKILNVLNGLIFLGMGKAAMAEISPNAKVAVGWTIPSFADIIGFVIKFMFFIGGLVALLFLLLGALAWVTSSGDKEAVKKAQDKIQAAVVGLVVIVAVLVIIATLEQVVLRGTFCVGLTCNIAVPQLINGPTQ